MKNIFLPTIQGPDAAQWGAKVYSLLHDPKIKAEL